MIGMALRDDDRWHSRLRVLGWWLLSVVGVLLASLLFR